ncbi:hypothetical protein GUJ93_ZPchr0002g26454 [Zizania palustris]|uniref:Uncharacterized protein n=1 Tax=Zizania palustris TaxID=103762 RepID=A0A8J5VEL8_ZIZPA|nr:hypothetical protein GUJ93_ZPchr0002g26454 [Zizania palustris]
MGTQVGHVAPGAGFLVIGLWQLFNHIRLFALRPSSYAAPVWFPVRGVRYLELGLVIVGTVASILMELVIGPARHQPFDDDGTIPSYHLHNFEHASISLALLVFAAVTIHMDRVRAPMRDAVSQLVAAAAFAQQLLIFHLHSADHMGVEGQFHWLLQTVIAVTLATTLLGIPCPRSFAVSLVRSASLVFQGVWFIVMGVMLWTPPLIPKGCFLNYEEGHDVVRCRTDEALHRAKSLVNLQFSWYLTGTVVFVVVLYLQLIKRYPEEPRYVPLVKGSGDGRFSIGDDDEDDLEAAKGGIGHVASGGNPMEIDSRGIAYRSCACAIVRRAAFFPVSRHGGEAIDRPKEPPPPSEAAAEKVDGSQELQLPAEIDWDRLDKWRFFVLGAGLFSAVSTALYPAVVLKTRLQVAPAPPPAHAASGAALPPSAAAAATAILRREGPLAFYRGFATSLAGTVPARALYMGALEATRSAIGPAALRLGAPEPAASAAAGAAAGLAAAVAAQVVWTPVDVISQRLMVQGNPCPSSRYRGGLDAFRKIVASEGLRGLYRGFGMSILTYAPSNAVWWATYSLSQKTIWSGIGCYLCEYGVGVQEIDAGEGDSSLQPGYKTVMVVQGVSAAMAGGAAALVTMPLDTIKTRMQVMDGGGEPITVGRTVQRLIKEGGWGACYRGLGPRWASMSLSATTMITTYEFLKRLSAKGQESFDDEKKNRR